MTSTNDSLDVQAEYPKDSNAWWLPPGARLNIERANHAADFFADVLVHTKGRWARRPFELTPWQANLIVKPLFGAEIWSDQWDCWTRLYIEAWIELARKNGKSELMAGSGLYLLAADWPVPEEEAEIYGCAVDRDQAGIIFQVAKRMVELSPVLSQHLTVIESRKRIICEATGSFYQVVAADGAGNLGSNPHAVLFDEVITQRTRELWDAVRQGFGARTQSLLLAGTTAGMHPVSFAAEEHKYSEKLIGEPQLDPRRFVFMRNTAKDLDPFNEANWHWANPALGNFLSLDVLRKEAAEAKLKPSAEIAFRVFRLNQWAQAADSAIPVDVWDAAASEVRTNEDALDLLATLPEVFGALDLASTRDFTAACWHGELDDGTVVQMWRFWYPADRLAQLEKMTAGQAGGWIADGWLKLTPGDVVDFETIESDLTDDARRLSIRALGYDPWGATQLAQSLSDSVETIELRQGMSTMAPASKAWEHQVFSESIDHGQNPVARWMITNLVWAFDSNGNFRPDRKRSTEKIDGAVASIMAAEVARRLADSDRSAYEDRGVMTV